MTLINVKLPGEGASSDKDTAVKCVPKFQGLVKADGFDEKVMLVVMLAKNFMFKELLEIFYNIERERIKYQKQRQVQDGGAGGC